jgi:serine/threonine protein phosphatase PrpC
MTYRALLCVADGMGGMEAGEIASQTAIGVIVQEATASQAERWAVTTPAAGAGAATAPATLDTPPEGDAPLDPVALIRRAATAVHAAAQGRQLGTTVTCVAVQDGQLTLGHVGDTRAYLLRSGTLTRLTADHSLVAAMVASGVITPEEAHGHPDSNKVLRSLGSQRALPDGYVDSLEAAAGTPALALQPGDWIMLCSDGVWGSVDDPEIQTAFAGAPDSQTVARILIDRALAAGAPDNATAVVARCIPMAVL